MAINSLANRAYAYYLQQGLPAHQAAALAGGFGTESQGDTAALHVGDNYRNSPNAPHSVGAGQWNGRRAENLRAYAEQQGIDVPRGDLRDPKYAQRMVQAIPENVQYNFALHEMGRHPQGATPVNGAGFGTEAAAGNRIFAAQTPEQAQRAAVGYWRPQNYAHGYEHEAAGWGSRSGMANELLRNPRPSTDQAQPNQQALALAPGQSTPDNQSSWQPPMRLGAPPMSMAPQQTPAPQGEALPAIPPLPSAPPDQTPIAPPTSGVAPPMSLIPQTPPADMENPATPGPRTPDITRPPQPPAPPMSFIPPPSIQSEPTTPTPPAAPNPDTDPSPPQNPFDTSVNREPDQQQQLQDIVRRMMAEQQGNQQAQQSEDQIPIPRRQAVAIRMPTIGRLGTLHIGRG